MADPRTTLTIVEHSSATYAPRTYHNAQRADLTAAIALDFDTAGERLTRKAAGDRYVRISLLTDPHEAADRLLQAFPRYHVRTLNVAGNGIYTLAGKGWTQERVDAYVFTVLAKATSQWSIAKVISGGQTGMDLAAVTAAYALGIASEATLPKGFIQRGPDGRDCTHTAEEIRRQIESGAARLPHFVNELTPMPRGPRVLNIRRDRIPPQAAYIGRGKYRGQSSKVGNPFVIGPDGDRKEVCGKFEAWAPTQPDIMAAIDELRGRDLACFCAPYRCHGDFILRMANREITPSNVADPAPVSSPHFNPQI